jgi:hypothetical protein
VSKILDFYAYGTGTHDFYRCYSCHALFTHEQEVVRIAAMGDEKAARMCACGSRKYVATTPIRLEWQSPSVISYTAKLILARGLAPKLPKFLLPLVEFFVGNPTTR